MEKKYTLKEPKQLLLRKSHYHGKWYVVTKESSWMYLRKSLEVLKSTGVSEGINVGFWDTYEEALKAKEMYEKIWEKLERLNGEHDDHIEPLSYTMKKEVENIIYTSNINDYEGMRNDCDSSSIRGNGGMVNYYEVPKRATQLSDLIYHKKMNHSVGEAFCALYRLNDNGERERNIRKVIRYMELELKQCSDHS